jgi:hypothetical protein
LVTLLKLGGEASIFFHLRDRQQGDLKRTAMLLWGELRRLTGGRFALGVVGGMMLPLGLLTSLTAANAGLALTGAVLSLVCLVMGDMLERMTFFTASSARRMPGGLQ